MGSAARMRGNSAGSANAVSGGAFIGGGRKVGKAKHPKAIAAVKLMRTKMVQEVGPDGVPRFVRPGVPAMVRADEQEKTPRVPGGADERGHRQPLQEDLFLTCGDPAGTLPSRCPFDRAHETWSGRYLMASATVEPGPPGSRGVRVRGESLARRYPAALLDGRGYSVDAQMDAQCERELMLASWGVKGYGRVDDESNGYRAVDRLFAGRSPSQVRTILRWSGVSNALGPIGAHRVKGGE